MSRPRYSVAICTGWTITGGGNSRGGSGPPGLSASVLDTWHAHREIARFRSEERRRVFGGGVTGPWGALANALALAATLNGDDG
jgi:hypothetical protein